MLLLTPSGRARLGDRDSDAGGLGAVELFKIDEVARRVGDGYRHVPVILARPGSGARSYLLRDFQ
jgi:hypothetical protein